MTRTLQEIRADRSESDTLTNLIALVDAKLELCSRLGVYEYEAGEDGLPECADIFRRTAEQERLDVQQLLEHLCERLPELLANSVLEHWTPRPHVDR